MASGRRKPPDSSPPRIRGLTPPARREKDELMPMTALQSMLVCLLTVPVVGAVLAALLGGRRPVIRWVALVDTLIGLVFAATLTVSFTQLRPVPQTSGGIRTF